MVEVEKILLPTDFSEASQRALPHAVELARRLDAELILAHIRTPYSDDPNRPEYHFLDEGRYSAFVEKELEKTSNHVGSEHRVTTLIGRNVSPAAGILEGASERGADLIVMGTHGRSALGRFFLGSVAEKVVRHASVPVVTVASKREGYRDNPGYRNILAAYDFSVHSREATSRARVLAKLYGARLTVLYVIEQEIHPGYYETWQRSIAEAMPRIVEDARKSLLEVLGEEGLDDVDVRVEVGDGDGRAHRDITRFAKEREIDLIVMGTYGLSGVEHMLLGSTTERVVRIAPCPVLTLHLSSE
jgi:nucleotide-binding universal stress UspA family protein